MNLRSVSAVAHSALIQKTVLASVSVLALSSALASAPSIALAQTTASSASDPDRLPEVVVTSRKRVEKLQDVPLAITALGSQQLEAAGAKSLADILSLTPGVTLTGSSSEAGQGPVIRGAYNLNNAGGGTSNVAVFADGVYIANTSALSLGLIDLDRVEIIKGPTSALYGRTGFSGAINYVSKKPTDDLRADVDAELGQYGRYNVAGDVNGPIVAGVLRAGLGVYYGTADGDYKDSVTGRSAGDFKKRDIKGTFDYTPTSQIDISGGYYYGDDHFGQNTLVYATPNCANGGAVCGKFIPNPIEVSNIPSSSGNSGNTRKVQNANLKASYDFGFATLSYLGGYNRVTERAYEDFSGLRYGLNFPLTPGPGTANVYELFGGDQNTEDYSQEIRLTSRADQPFRWSLGGDYYQSRAFLSTLIGFDGAQIPAGQQIVEFFGFLPNNIFVTPNGSPSTSNFTGTAGTDKNTSVFGSAEYDILSNLTASGELRSTRDNQSQDIQANAFIANTFRPYGAPTTASFNYTNYRATLRYKPTSDLMVYATAANGTKPGGFNSRATIPSEISYQPEKNTTYELGAKIALLERKLVVDAAVYHVDDVGLQINGPSSDPKNVGQVVKNFGGTKNDGFEISAAYTPIRQATFTFGIAYTDPKYTSGTYDYNGAATCALVPSCASRVTTVTTPQGTKATVVNLQGLQEEFTSQVQLNLGLDLHGKLTSSLDWFAHGDYRYSSKQYAGFEDIYYEDDVNWLNLNVGIKKANYQVSVFVKNALDNRSVVYAQPATELNGTTKFIANLPDRRNVGVELSYHY